MVKEICIEAYLLLFKLMFNLCKCFPLRQKTLILASFSQNCLFVYNEMKRQDIPYKIIFICKKNSHINRQHVPDAIYISMDFKNPVNWVRLIYHLATSQWILVDNYYPFLAAVNFKNTVQCIQLWHAAGAIKTFGFRDRSVAERSARARKRFKKVYNNFHKIVVGSEAMAKIFMDAFGCPPEKILRSGIPRTDLFYDSDSQSRIIKKLTAENKELKRKKVILYAPTYRDDQIHHFNLKLDMHRMYRELGDEYIVLLKLHPAIKNTIEIEKLYPGFVYDYSLYPDINELLLVTDILITDYSSVPYEYALLKRPMIFYPYDLKEYVRSRGLWGEYEKLVPGPVVYNMDDLIETIKNGKFDLDKIEEFSRTWNQYSTGHSSRNLVHYLFVADKAEEQPLEHMEQGL